VADGDALVTIVPHLSGNFTICVEDCVRIHLEELDPPPRLDIPPLLKAESDEFVVLEDDRSRPERPVLIAIVGRRVDMRSMSNRLEEAREAGETVEVHVYDPEQVGGE
jgi:hypothetical protein